MLTTICLPISIIRNGNLSPRARIVWAELSLLPRGFIGEFVIKQKELSKILDICPSTLRRALKELVSQKLIQFVGVFEKKFKKFIFINQASLPLVEPTPPPKKIEPRSGSASLSYDVEKAKQPNVPYRTEPAAPIKDDLFRIMPRFDRKETKHEVDLVKDAVENFRYFSKDWIIRFAPFLNGKNGRPLLDVGLVACIVLRKSNEFRPGEMAITDYIENQLLEFCHTSTENILASLERIV